MSRFVAMTHWLWRAFLVLFRMLLELLFGGGLIYAATWLLLGIRAPGGAVVAWLVMLVIWWRRYRPRLLPVVSWLLAYLCVGAAVSAVVEVIVRPSAEAALMAQVLVSPAVLLVIMAWYYTRETTQASATEMIRRSLRVQAVPDPQHRVASIDYADDTDAETAGEPEVAAAQKSLFTDAAWGLLAVFAAVGGALGLVRALLLLLTGSLVNILIVLSFVGDLLLGLGAAGCGLGIAIVQRIERSSQRTMVKHSAVVLAVLVGLCLGLIGEFVSEALFVHLGGRAREGLPIAAWLAAQDATTASSTPAHVTAPPPSLEPTPARPPTAAPVQTAVWTVYVANTDADGVIVRYAKYMTATTSTVLPEGSTMTLALNDEGWARITSPALGYIPPQYWSYSRPSIPATPRVLYVSADGDGLFIRSKPDTEARVKVWPDGTAVEALAREGDWWRVRAPDGYVGYMPARYLSTVKPTPVPIWPTPRPTVWDPRWHGPWDIPPCEVGVVIVCNDRTQFSTRDASCEGHGGLWAVCSERRP